MYDGYAFEVICERRDGSGQGHYPKDHDYPAVPKDEFMTNFLFVRRLRRMAQRLEEIEKKIDILQLRGSRAE